MSVHCFNSARTSKKAAGDRANLLIVQLLDLARQAAAAHVPEAKGSIEVSGRYEGAI